MSTEVSETMHEVLRFMRAQVDQSIYRHQGGYWSGPQLLTFYHTWGTSTVQGLVKRGLIEYCAWRSSTRGGPDFPVAAKLTQAGVDTCKPLE